MITNIPKHWKIKKLGEICKVNQGLQIAIEERFTEPIENGYFYITNEFLKANSKTKYYIKNPSKSVLCSKEDILMTRTGNTGIVVSDVEGVFHNNFFKIDYDKKLLHKDYLVYYLKNDRMQYDILVKAGNSTIPDLNHSDFYTLQIVIPPLEEQEKIAEILLTCDKAIRLTTQIITQLKQRNQGLSQQLLTGEKRVKGFEKSIWKSFSISEICKIGRGRVISAKYISENKGIYPVYSSQTQNEGVFGKINTYDFEGEYITWTTDGVNAGTVSFREGKFNCTNVCGTLKVIDVNNFSHKFLAYKLATIAFQYVSYTLANPKLMNNTMGDIIIDLPEIDEQNAIAQILDTAHQELKLYEQKLQLLQAQKKTLMQKLLTGEVLTIK